MTASIWDMNRLQAFATVFLARDTITPPPDLWDQVLGFVVRLCFDP
jgi:hypothetical protein